MNKKAIEQQSDQAFKQWGEQWKEHAHAHKSFDMKPMNDFENIGLGKAVLCVANGYSLEENIETIRAHQNKVDILCCDKTLGTLLDNGITPTYCMVCDANVDYERYMAPWKDSLGGTIVFQNVCANPKWVKNGNWKDKYFFANKDVRNYEKIFIEITGCKNVIPAGTNVSNAMVILLTQSDNTGRRNFFAYDKILLIGYDYSWRLGGKYYAFDEDGGGKVNYMRHIHANNMRGEPCYTSNNLAFSANWLDKYVKTFRLPVVQCSKSGVFSASYQGELEEQMQYNYKQEDRTRVKNFLKEMAELKQKVSAIDQELKGIALDHYKSLRATI